MYYAEPRHKNDNSGRLYNLVTQRSDKHAVFIQYLSSQAYFDAVNTCLAGGTRQRISRGNLAQFNVPIPSSKIEQEKIGEVLEKLDTLITLHQREHIKSILEVKLVKRNE